MFISGQILAVFAIGILSVLLILSISRRGNRLVVHGYPRLELGGDLTVVGMLDSLAEVEVTTVGAWKVTDPCGRPRVPANGCPYSGSQDKF